MAEGRKSLVTLRRLVALVVAMALMMGFIATSAGATAPARSISGTVRDAEGDPVAGALVYMFQADMQSYVTAGFTDASGAYTVAPPSGGHYKLLFTSSGYAEQWWNNKAIFEYADGIMLGDTANLTSYDATLSRAGSIVGTVAPAAGVSLPLDGWVSLYNSLGQNYGAQPVSGPGYSFQFTGLQPGVYHLAYEPGDDRLIGQYFNGAATIDGATAVRVASDVTQTAVFDIHEGSTVKGRVTDETTGFQGVSVDVFDIAGNFTRSGTTDVTGNYAIEGLPAGQYKVHFHSPKSEYVDEYFNRKTTEWNADVVSVSGVETKTADAQLAKGASIEGTVTGPTGAALPRVGVSLSGMTADGESWSRNATTQDGKYAIDGIPNGKYTVHFDPSDINASNLSTLTPVTGLAGEYWNDQATAARANQISITGATTTKNVNASLSAGGRIKGTVKGLTGGVLGSIPVTAFLMNGRDDFEQVQYAYTGPDGTYEIKGLAPGSYVIAFGGGVPSYYPNGARSFDAATKIALTAGQTVAGVNSVVALDSGRLEGRVVGTDGKPAPRVKVVFSRETAGTWAEAPGDYVYTDPDGAFGTWAVGSVRLRFTDAAGRYADTSYPSMVDVEAGRSVLVTQTLPFIAVDSAEGADRYATCVQSSKRAFPTGAGGLVIATGSNWPDALGGAGLVRAAGGPILLVKKDSIPASVMTEIQRLDNKGWIRRIYILGSTSVVSAAVESQLREMFDFEDQKPSVVRLAGSTRYETADAIAKELTDVEGRNFDGTALVATGLNYPDSLAASPLAAVKGWPLFLVGSTGVSQAQLDSMAAKGVKKVVLLGSAAVLPKATVEDKLVAKFGAGNVKRLGGGTRYSTAIEIAKYGVGTLGMTWNSLGIATGTNFPDGLAGGVLQGANNGVMLLTPGASLDPGVEAVIRQKKSEIFQVRFFGSTAAVSKAVRDKIAAARK